MEATTLTLDNFKPEEMILGPPMGKSSRAICQLYVVRNGKVFLPFLQDNGRASNFRRWNNSTESFQVISTMDELVPGEGHIGFQVSFSRVFPPLSYIANVKPQPSDYEAWREWFNNPQVRETAYASDPDALREVESTMSSYKLRCAIDDRTEELLIDLFVKGFEDLGQEAVSLFSKSQLEVLKTAMGTTKVRTLRKGPPVRGKKATPGDPAALEELKMRVRQAWKPMVRNRVEDPENVETVDVEDGTKTVRYSPKISYNIYAASLPRGKPNAENGGFDFKSDAEGRMIPSDTNPTTARIVDWLYVYNDGDITDPAARKPIIESPEKRAERVESGEGTGNVFDLFGQAGAPVFVRTGLSYLSFTPQNRINMGSRPSVVLYVPRRDGARDVDEVVENESAVMVF